MVVPLDDDLEREVPCMEMVNACRHSRGRMHVAFHNNNNCKRMKKTFMKILSFSFVRFGICRKVSD